MKKPLFSQIFFAMILLISALACASLPGGTPDPAQGTTPDQDTTSDEGAYRYDDLPDAESADDTLAEFRAISQWGKTTITYYFMNGTEKLSGDTEHDRAHSHHLSFIRASMPRPSRMSKMTPP